jgi:hypothetical protein
MEQVNLGMVALIDHIGRDQAIWVGHDWVKLSSLTLDQPKDC